MDNTTFATTLEAYANWLRREIETADAALKKVAPDLERHVQRTYVGPQDKTFLALLAPSPMETEARKKPENWEEIETTAVVLDGLRRVVEVMENSLTRLAHPVREVYQDSATS